MRKEVVFVLIFILSASVSALTIELENSYSQKQTVIVQIQGNLQQQIQEEQVKLLKGNSYVAIEHGLQSIDDERYLWFVTPSSEGNYKLTIENIQAIENGESVLIDYEKNFTVGNETAEYYIQPGAVIALSDFFITAKNNRDYDVNINVDAPSAREVVLKPGETKINFDIDEFEGTQSTILNIGIYGVPSKIFGKKITSGNPIEENETEGANGTQDVEVRGNYTFEFGSPVIRTKVLDSSVGKRIKFQIRNIRESDLPTLRFALNDEYFLIDEQSYYAEDNETAEFELVVKKIPEGVFREAVSARIGEYQKYFLIILEKTDKAENESEVEYVPEEEGNSFYYCAELGGKFCGVEQSCSEDEVDSLDGMCCLAECNSGSSGGIGSWIGYLIAAIILVVIAIVFLKYKKVNENKESAIKERFISAEKKTP